MKVGEFFKKNDIKITLLAYLLPIIFSVIVSLAHVVTFWEIANPLSWAIFLSIAVEVGVLSSLAASRISNWVWLPFSLVTLIQIVGNVFYSYVNTSITSPLFKSWVELSDPFFNFIGLGTDGDLVVHRRIVATMLGSFVPLIAIVFFQFFIRSIRKISSGGTIVSTTLGQPKEPENTAIAVKNDSIGHEIAPEKLPVPLITAEAAKIEPSAEDVQAANAAPPDDETDAPEWYKKIDFAKLKALPPEVWKQIVEDAEKPNAATEAIQNMTKIDPAKLQEPYMQPVEPMGKLFYFTPEIKSPQPSEDMTVPLIETLPEPVNNEETPVNDERSIQPDGEIIPEQVAPTTKDELPEVASDYVQPEVAPEPDPVIEAPAGVTDDKMQEIIKKWADAGLMEGLKRNPTTALIEETPAQPAIMVVEDEKKK